MPGASPHLSISATTKFIRTLSVGLALVRGLSSGIFLSFQTSISTARARAGLLFKPTSCPASALTTFSIERALLSHLVRDGFALPSWPSHSRFKIVPA
jgi:hypothetical protein